MADTANQEYSRDAGDYNETGDSSSNVEWRSCLQVENGTPSTSPFWDTDSDEDGPKPVELFGKHTWKIENFSKITKRELRSEPFDAGGYKWYILIYPQGCDVCNHISLFLCVANHDKLLPGWSHFAQFTIAVVNKDPKKSKYSDTLHRFWKKEHDWGWKKFMELTKVQDGFLVEGVLVIKAQVQVIREKPDRPFRCLDRLYRRELVRIYMTNIENIYRRFVEEKRNRLSKLIDDKSRWSSFHAFWRGTSTNSRYAMSREKTDTILKILVKQFFIEKEVTSTLVMDSLYSGLRALELQSVEGKKWRGSRPAELERMPAPMVRVEKDMFVLADDVIGLLERAVLEQLPAVKDDKVSQNRTTKDGNTIEETSKDTIERDERRLTEIGRRILEIFTLAHIYSIIEVAYQEAVALKRQEELIREEEAWMNEPDTKSKRDNKDKKSKKKQGKQKKNNKKGKEKEKILDEVPEENENLFEDLNEDISENGEDATNGDDGSNGEVVAADLENVESSPVKDFAESEILKDEWTGKKSYSSDNWVPVGSANKGANSSNYKNHTSSPNRAKAQRSKIITEKSIPAPVVINNTNEKMGPTHFVTRSNEQTGPTSFVANSNVTPGASSDSSGSNGRATTPQPMHKLENRAIEKEQTIPLQKKLEIKSQPQLQINLPSRPATPKAAPVSSTPSPPEKPSPTITKPFTPLKTTPSPSSATPPNSATFGAVRPVLPSVTPRPTLSTIPPLVPEPVKTVPKPVMLSPSLKPIIAPDPVNPLRNTSPIVPPAAAQRPATPMAAPVQATSYLAPSPPAPSFIPQSYRNAIMGSNGNTSTCPLAGPNPNHPNPLGFSAQAAHLLSRIEAEKAESNLSFFSTSPCGAGWIQNDNGSDNPFCTKTVSQLVAEEFPHLDMINGLLDDLSDGELYCPHNGTVGHPYRPFPKTSVNLASGSGRVDPLREMGLASGSGRHDLLRNMSFTNGSGRNDPLRDMGLASMTGRNDPLREMGLGSLTGRNDPLGDMGLNSITGRNDPLRDPLREMGLTSGLGRVDPLYEMGVSNASRVYSSNLGGNSSSMFNNLPSYHHVNGHYDYSSDLGMNLNLGAELNNGYGIRDYANFPGASGINRLRYPYDNGL